MVPVRNFYFLWKFIEGYGRANEARMDRNRNSSVLVYVGSDKLVVTQRKCHTMFDTKILAVYDSSYVLHIRKSETNLGIVTELHIRISVTNHQPTTLVVTQRKCHTTFKVSRYICSKNT